MFPRGWRGEEWSVSKKTIMNKEVGRGTKSPLSTETKVPGRKTETKIRKVKETLGLGNRRGRENLEGE